MRYEISYSLFQEHEERNEKMNDSINLSNNKNAANENIILCFHKHIIQERTALKKNITNNKIYNVARLKPNKNVKMIPPFNDPKVKKIVACIPNDSYYVSTNKLQKKRK